MAQNNSTLYFLSYNNYYNRIVKKEDSLDDYLDYQAEYTPLVCNFNPADGVDTEHIINTSYLANGPEADYIVVVDENNEIVSRWFIVEADRLRGGQYRLVLRRDLVVDFFEDIVNAPAYVERAMCNTGNNLIFNSENLLVNQIKQKETLLKDKTGCPWIVGYAADNFTFREGITDGIISTSSLGAEPPVLSQYSYNKWLNFQSKGIHSITSADIIITGFNNIQTKVASHTIGSHPSYRLIENIGIGSNSSWFNRLNIKFSSAAVGDKQGPVMNTELQQLMENNQSIDNQIFDYFADNSYDIPVLKTEELEAALTESGVLLYDENNNQFRARISAVGYSNITLKLSSGGLYNTIKDILLSADAVSQNFKETIGDKTWELITLFVSYNIYKVSVERYNTTVASTKLLPDKVRTLRDAPYKMFCIPYPVNDALSIKLSSDKTITPEAAISMNMAISISKKLTKDQVYDLQLLPYCPIPALIDAENGGVDLSEVLSSTNGNYSLEKASEDSKAVISPICEGLTGEGKIISAIIWCEESSFTNTINMPITVPANNIDFKVEHECSFYRLNSPNYHGSFQFKATSNRGIDYFTIRATYKPYHPYIHISPNFKGLYGGNYDDARGLVCGGDFSLPTITDAWESYQIQNKNFLNSFNRQIENMETVYDLQREQQRIASGINVATAGISGGASGAITGGQIGGGYGAAIGAGIGATAGITASAIGRKQDLRFLQLQHNEAMSYTKDQFNLSLQNIQALPYSLNNISAYDINNKFFPFLEYFSCSNEEKEAVRSKITYRSMTVNAMGTIANYIAATPSFISAQLIRLDDVKDDYHVAVAIAEEIHQGVYI